MRIKSAQQIINIGILVAAAAFLFFMLFGRGSGTVASTANVYAENGMQTVTLSALGGYQPSLTQAKGGLPTKLIVDTKNTFDCSAALTIPSLGVNRLLPPNGKTEIDLGTPIAGTEIFGTCTMGMYNFRIKFS